MLFDPVRENKNVARRVNERKIAGDEGEERRPRLAIRKKNSRGKEAENRLSLPPVIFSSVMEGPAREREGRKKSRTRKRHYCP